MSIRCGNCGERHESALLVRNCYALEVTDRPRTEASERGEDYRPNKFAGTCCLCGNPVGEGEGRIDRRDSGTGWNVSHLSGECPERKATEREDFSVVTQGYYATESTRKDQDYDFWYVKEGRKPGYRFVKRYLGGQGPIRISQGEAIKALRSILAEGVEKCGIRFADEHCRCWKCGLPLTDEVSRERRQGPVCWAK